MAPKYLLLLEPAISVSTLGIGQLSLLVAALTVLRSFVVWNIDPAFLGTRFEADCYKTYALGSM